jgi:hypothetical protein
MASRTTTRVVVAAALVGAAAYFAPEALDTVGTFLGDAVGANDAVTLGEGEAALLVAANAKAKLVNCDPETIVTAKSCDGLRILVVDASRMPARENQCQGPTYRDQYPPDGTRFLVVISRPDLVASVPYTGVDIAKDQGWC